MTSRASFYKLYKETLRRHFTSILILVVAFVIHLITIVLSLQNYVELLNEYNSEVYLERIVDLFSPNIANGVFALAAGLFLAFDFFRYLHSKMQTDFYESLPVRKSDLFVTNVICSISVFAFLSIITFGLELLVVNVFGHGTITILKNLFWNLLCTNLCFIASFLTAVLAWVMTGHPIVALLGYGAFTGYNPIVLCKLFPVFAAAYFDTYVSMPVFTKINWNSIFYYLSPGSLMAILCSETSNIWNIKEHYAHFIAIIVFSVIIGYLAFLLYKKRPSETCGRAMAFSRINAPIRILVVVPISLYGGLLLQELSSSYMSFAWLIFGIIFIGFIIHGLMEAIFEADVRAAFKKKKQLLLSYGICFAFLSIFWFDLFNYDEYIPNENKVENIYIESNTLRVFNHNIENQDGLTPALIKPALQAAKDIVSIDRQEFTEASTITFNYELKNGMIIAREYAFDIYNIPSSLDNLSKEDEFKDDVLMLYDFDPEAFTNIFTQSNYEETILDLSYREEIFAAYLEEYRQLSLSDSFNTPIECQLIGEWIIPSDNETIQEYTTNCWFPIYSTFENTIALMKKAGYVPFQDLENVTITQLTINPEKYDDEPAIITDLALLEELKPFMKLNDYSHFFYNDEWYNGTIRIETSFDELYLDIVIPKDVF